MKLTITWYTQQLILFSIFMTSTLFATKIIDYDNVVENPYYRKSNLDLLIRRHCNFLQVKTSPTPAPPKMKFSDRLQNAIEELGIPVKNKAELPSRLVDGLVSFIRTVYPGHEFSHRNITDSERNKLEQMLPELIENMEDDTDLYEV